MGIRRAAASLALLPLLLVLPGSAAAAGPYVVEVNTDEADPAPGDGLCRAVSDCTLRAAIQEANATPEPDEIQFSLMPGMLTIAPAGELPALTAQTIIDGTTQGASAVPLVQIDGAAAGTGADGISTAPGQGDASLIRGLAIFGFDGSGILVDHADDVRIEGNFIGTANGTFPIGNGAGGIRQVGGDGTVIGGPDQADVNVISGNLSDGIAVAGGAEGLDIRGNLVGTTATGTTGLANNGHGIFVDGGSGVAADNLVASNQGDGIRLAAGTVELLRNRTASNGGLGVNLVAPGDPPSGVTPLDAGDADTGPNALQNHPTLERAVRTTDSTAVAGTLSTSPGGVFRIEFFSSSGCDPSGNGEGDVPLGSTVVTTDGNGEASFLALADVTPLGRQITATATAVASGSTSELSGCVQTVNGATVTVLQDTVPDDAQDFAYTASGTGLQGFVLDDDGPAGSGLADEITFALTVPELGAKTITQGEAPGWKLDAASCDGVNETRAGAELSFSVVSGDEVVCNFANSRIPPPTDSGTPPPTTVPTPPPAKKCKKGRKLKRGKCVKKKRKRR